MLKQDKSLLLKQVSGLESKDLMESRIEDEYEKAEQRLLNPASFDAIIAEESKLDSLKQRLNDEINRAIDRENKARIEAAGIGLENTKPVIATKKRKYYRLNEISKKVRTIESQQDIEVVLSELKKELEQQLQENTIIELM